MSGGHVLKCNVEFFRDTHSSPVTGKVTHRPTKVGKYSVWGIVRGGCVGEDVGWVCREGFGVCVSVRWRGSWDREYSSITDPLNKDFSLVFPSSSTFPSSPLLSLPPPLPSLPSSPLPSPPLSPLPFSSLLSFPSPSLSPLPSSSSSFQHRPLTGNNVPG